MRRPCGAANSSRCSAARRPAPMVRFVMSGTPADRKAFLLHFAQEEAVKRKTFSLIALLASVIAAGLPTTGLFATKGAAQSPQTQARGVPVFEVDPAWPKL